MVYKNSKILILGLMPCLMPSLASKTYEEQTNARSTMQQSNMQVKGTIVNTAGETMIGVSITIKRSQQLAL